MTATPIALSLAQRGDLPELHALIERAYRGESARAGWTHEADLVETPRTDVATLQAILDDPQDALLIAREGGEMIGCVQISRHGPGVAYLGLLTVDPGRQGGGTGKRILAAAERDAIIRFGAERMQLSAVSVRSELIAYYERRGYVPTGEVRPFPVPLDPPLTLTVLDKPLAAVTGAA